jgi:hypothetical protein
MKVATNLGLLSGSGLATGAISSSLVAGGFILGPIFQILLPTFFIMDYFKKKKLKEELLQASTSLSADLFLKEGVRDWIQHHKKEMV